MAVSYTHLYFRNQPVGCTATIITQMYMENGIEIPEKIAGLLCSAILSDTLMSVSYTHLTEETGGAWLSSARVVRCWVKSRNERNPCP